MLWPRIAEVYRPAASSRSANVTAVTVGDRRDGPAARHQPIVVVVVDAAAAAAAPAVVVVVDGGGGSPWGCRCPSSRVGGQAFQISQFGLEVFHLRSRQVDRFEDGWVEVVSCIYQASSKECISGYPMHIL